MSEKKNSVLNWELEDFLKNSTVTKKKAWRFSEDYKNQWYQKKIEQLSKMVGEGDINDKCCY